MSLFAHHTGRHCRRGTCTGWAGLARIYAETHPVDDYTVPRTHQTPIEYGKAPR